MTILTCYGEIVDIKKESPNEGTETPSIAVEYPHYKDMT